MIYHLDKGLEFPYAENILREMDVNGKLGLKNAPDRLLNEARERTQGNPRALEALFAILSADRETTLPDILNDTKNLLPEHVVNVLVGEAFSRIDVASQRVMQALAVYSRPVASSAVDYLLHPYMQGMESAPVLKRLVNMQLVRKEEKHYYMHPVDRDYALSRVPEGTAADREAETPPFTRFALLHRGADYFKLIRMPRENWKKIDDLAPQLAEFDLRCRGEDFDTASRVLFEIDFDYLLLWGQFRLMIEMHKRLEGKLSDSGLRSSSAGNLGTAYSNVGEYRKAIQYCEKALAIDKEIGDRRNEGVWLGNLGLAYSALGQVEKAIQYYEKALAIDKEIGDRRGEGTWLNNLGAIFMDKEKYREALSCLLLAKDIRTRIKDPNIKTTDSNLQNLKEKLGEKGFEKLAAEAAPRAEEIVRKMLESSA
jgi:tetratricopeptide (TPR) repeat protein